MEVKTLRALLIKASADNTGAYHIDFLMAYLSAEFSEKSYMDQIPEFESTNKRFVLRLNKSIYGLKQSAWCWHECLCAALTSIGFKQSMVDKCLFSKQDENSQFCHSVCG